MIDFISTWKAVLMIVCLAVGAIGIICASFLSAFMEKRTNQSGRGDFENDIQRIQRDA